MKSRVKLLAAFGIGLLFGCVVMFLFMGLKTRKVMAFYTDEQLLEMAANATLLRAGMDDVLLKRYDDAIPRIAVYFNREYRKYLKNNQAHEALWAVQRYYDHYPSVTAPPELELILSSLPADPRSTGRLRSLKDQPAPDFELDTLDGGHVKLSDHKGKNVVILDFWAASCMPCRRSMAIVERVAEKFEDRDVVMYAVNQREKPETIRAFLQEQNLNVVVALDTDGTVGDKSKQVIPTTIIIGKDGIIKAYHVGVTPEDELVEALKATFLEDINVGDEEIKVIP